MSISPWASAYFSSGHQYQHQHPYTLTLEHVQQFLATREDLEPIGYTGHSRECLLARTLNWLYPQQAPWAVDPMYYGPSAYLMMDYAPSTPQRFLLLPELSTLVEFFDHIRIPGEDRLVRKGELRERLEFLETSAPHKLPCPVTALFPQYQEREKLVMRLEDRLYRDYMAWRGTFPPSPWKDAFAEPAPGLSSIASVLEEAESAMEKTGTEKKEEVGVEPEQMPVLELALA